MGDNRIATTCVHTLLHGAVAGLVGVFAITASSAAIVPKPADSPTAGLSPLTSKGVDAAQSYFQIGGAEVNAFNFNLVVSFSDPVGAETPVDGGLTLSLTRTYNSRVFELKGWHCSYAFGGYTPPGCVRTQPGTGGAWALPKAYSYLSVPRQTPMGLGWDFHLGRVYGRGRTICEPAYRSNLVPTYEDGQQVYQAPDGSEHTLVPAASTPFSSDGPLDGSSYYYTIDGSMIRARWLPPAHEGEDASWEVFLPDGRILEMRHYTGLTAAFNERGSSSVDCCNGPWEYFTPNPVDSLAPHLLPAGKYDEDKAGWHTSRIRLREEVAGEPAAWISVEYQDYPFDYIIRRITDSHGAEAGSGVRETLVTIGTNSSDVDYGLIRSISSAQPGGGSTSTAFTYEPRTLSVDPEHTLEVRLLKRVETAYGYRIEYGYESSVEGETEAVSALASRLNRIWYPSGKLVKLTYGSHERKWRDLTQNGAQIPIGCDCVDSGPLRAGVGGLLRKEEFADGDESNVAETNHRQWEFGLDNQLSQEGLNGEKFCPPVYDGTGHPVDCTATFVIHRYDSISTMVDPAGNRTEIVFDTSTGGGYNPDTPWHGAHESALFGTAKEEHTYEGASPEERQEVRSVLRTWAGVSADTCKEAKWSEVSREDEMFLDDGDGAATPVVTRAFSDWNGYGHFETETVSGSAIGGREIITHTDYAINNLLGEAACASATALKHAWLPGVVASSSVAERVGDETVVREATAYAYSTTTGRVNNEVRRATPAAPAACASTLGEIGPLGSDVVSSYQYDPTGNVERSTTGFGNAPTFGVDRTYWFGVESSVKRDGLNYFDVIRTVDPGTGLVTREEYNGTQAGSADAIVRTTQYDELRRPLSERVGSLEPWTVSYDDEDLPGWVPSGRRLAQIKKQRGSGSVLEESVEIVDYANRVVRRERLTPEESRAYQHTRYNQRGLVSFVSEWTSAQDPNLATIGTATSYSDPETGLEDPFGRPRLVTGALGETTAFRYFGTSRAVTTCCVAGGTADEMPMSVTTTYLSDGLGQLRVVDAPAGADAVYEYDHAGRLLKANLLPQVHLAPTVSDRFAVSDADGQVRMFAFDALGRQYSSTQPESGTSTVLSWNALGSPEAVKDASGAAQNYFHLTSYDGAGRPRQLDRVIMQPEEAFTERLQPEAWNRDNEGWNLVTSSKCLDEEGTGKVRWYVGSEQCAYEGNPESPARVTSIGVGPVPPGAVLVFEFDRQVRFTEPDKPPVDRFVVRVADADGPDWQKPPVWAIDSSSVSTGKWEWSPPIPLDEFVGRTIVIRFDFDVVQTNENHTVFGVAVGNVTVNRPVITTLKEMHYDETFGIAGNKARGELTSIVVRDEATGGVDFRRESHFVQNEGLLSDETQWVNWRKNGTLAAFSSEYAYDSFGRVFSQTMPHPGSSGRGYFYTYRHGALTGIESSFSGTSQGLVPDSLQSPGFEYNLAGGLQATRYANGIEEHVDANAAFLPARIWAGRPGSPTLFDTGTYAYDVARNIKQIGADLYRYDAAGRLSWARVTSNQAQGTIDVDPDYDVYGNMTSHATSNPAVVTGMHFTGRTYNSRNQIVGFTYDPNGNLVDEPPHDGVGGLGYEFSPENQMRRVNLVSAGKTLEEARYDDAGNRWGLWRYSKQNRALVTLRDASGQVASEYLEKADGSGLELQKEYVHGAGRLVAINSTCSPRSDLRLASPMIAGGAVRLMKTGGGTVMGPYSLVVSTGDGRSTSYSLPDNTADNFEIPLSWLYPNENNWIRIQPVLECGVPGYGAAVSVVYRSTWPIPGTGVTRVVTDQDGGSRLAIQATTNGQESTGTTYNVYFRPYTDEIPLGGPWQLNKDPLPTPWFELEDQPAGAGHGAYWFVPIVDGEERDPGPEAIDDARNSGTWQGEGTEAATVMSPQFVYWDHLGSTRLVTDALGVPIARYKYYPFGQEAEYWDSVGNRMQFTGHERDSDVRLDYMLARYYGLTLARFLSADPITVTSDRLLSPPSLNLYVYANNNPLRYIDPTGEDVTVPEQSGHRAVERMLMKTIRTPSGRAQFLAIAQNPAFNLVATDARLQSAQDVQAAKKQGGTLIFEMIPKAGAVDRSGDGKIDQIQMQLDTDAVATAHPDRSGVTTTAHGLKHAGDIMNAGTYEAGLKGDRPTPQTGAAEQFGQGASKEGRDISRKEAKKILKENIKR